MQIGIVARLDDSIDLKIVRKAIKLLNGEEILLEPKLAKKLGKRPGSAQELGKSDALITVGGDGTVLFAQRLAPNVPILGINLGRRGFLADVNPEEMPRALKMLKAGDLRTVERERLAVTANGKTLPDALNDVVVCSDKPGKTATLTVSIDGKVAMEMRCDGVIVATPTGSTAYAHAAGGPVIDPRLDAIVIVPICPTHPRTCPMVAPPDSIIGVVSARPKRDALVIVDGNPVSRICCGESVEVQRSGNYARFFEWGDFYRKSREKL